MPFGPVVLRLGLLPLFGVAVASPAMASDIPQQSPAAAPGPVHVAGPPGGDTPAAAAPQPKPTPEPDWAGTVELYGFAPLRTTVNSTVNGFSTEASLNLNQQLNALTSVFYLRGSVEYQRIGLLTDLSYLSLQGSTVRSGSGERLFRRDLKVPFNARVKLGTTQGIYDLALRYRFGDREKAISTPGAVTVIPYAGIRVLAEGISLSSSFSRGPLQLSSRSESFGDPIVQPLLGTQAQVFLAPRLRVFARGDVGGFTPNGNNGLTANAQLGFGYAVGNNTQLDLSWRYLHIARGNSGVPSSSYSVDENGFEIGVKVFF